MVRRAPLLLTLLLLVAPAVAEAAPDRELTVSLAAPDVRWDGGPVTQAPQTGPIDPDDTLLVLLDGGDLTVTIGEAGPTVVDIDVRLFRADADGAPSGEPLATGRTMSPDETLTAEDLPPGRYVARVQGVATVQGTYVGTAGLEAGSGGGPPDPLPVPAQPPAEDDHVGCVLDTGINATHQAFARGQVVAWWDFTAAPDAGSHFDRESPVEDTDGHGTATAAMVAGRPVGDATRSMAPGASLAIARVARASDEIDGDLLPGAIRWCVEHARADVISVSIGSLVPLPGAQNGVSAPVYRALDAAREAGVLVVVSNGNGAGDVGLVPSAGALSNYGSSLSVLAVGASGADGLTVSDDPEVAAQFRVRAPRHDSSTAVGPIAGTSFGAPLTAGFALSVLRASDEAGRRLTVGALEQLVKDAARDTELPPSTEGYGVIDAAQLPRALVHAREGTSPARPSPDVSALYVEEVAGAKRRANAGSVRPPGGR
jgi:hypothetical protein